MTRAPKALREERLRRFLKQRQETLDNIARMEEVVAKAKAAEEIEKDPDSLRRYIQTRITTEQNIAEAKAFLIRVKHLIEREQEWLTKYEDEPEDVAVSDFILSEEELALDPAVIAADTFLAASAGKPAQEAVRNALEKAKTNVKDLTLAQFDLLVRSYAVLAKHPRLEPPEENLRVALRKTVVFVDGRLMDLHAAWEKLRPTE